MTTLENRSPFCEIDQHDDCSGCICSCHEPKEPPVPPNHEDE